MKKILTTKIIINFTKIVFSTTPNTIKKTQFHRNETAKTLFLSIFKNPYVKTCFELVAGQFEICNPTKNLGLNNETLKNSEVHQIWRITANYVYQSIFVCSFRQAGIFKFYNFGWRMSLALMSLKKFTSVFLLQLRLQEAVGSFGSVIVSMENVTCVF